MIHTWMQPTGSHPPPYLRCQLPSPSRSTSPWRSAPREGTAWPSARSCSTTPLDLADDVVSDEPSAWQQLALRDAVRRLYQALERVDPAQRVAFALVVIDGRPVAEVAELTGTSRVAVKTRVWRARRALMVRAKRDPVLASYLTELGDAAEPMLSEAP